MIDLKSDFMAKSTVKRIAADILQVGVSRIRFLPSAKNKIDEALTREDVRALIKDGSIYAIPERLDFRGKWKERKQKRKKGRRWGVGSRKGTLKSRKDEKQTWIKKVRAQRKYLKSLVASGKLAKENYRKVYLMVKGNAFRGVKAVESYLKENKLLK
jgi:large subunit ribosomal protein L19e